MRSAGKGAIQRHKWTRGEDTQMDLMITAALMLLCGLGAGIGALLKRQGWKKALLFTAIGLVAGYLGGYWLAPLVISFY
jgi:hypothetical protein